MDKIKDKIAKLLALAESPNENEAQAALLKARKLMAEHKLRPEEVIKQKDAAIRQEGVGIFCTKMSTPWAVKLANTVAAHYCCKVVRYRVKNAKKSELGLMGLEDDFEICKRVLRYAYDCVQAKTESLRASRRKAGWRSSDIREMCNAYGWGFCYGLKEAFQKQDAEHQEWGLVMVVPQEVQTAYARLGKARSYASANVGGWRDKYIAEGFQDGKKFDPSRRLGQGAASQETS